MIEARSAAGVLVTGGSGFIGEALLRRLAAAGRPLTVVTRRRDRSFPPGTDVRVGDLATGEGLDADLLADIGIVFHCAGEVADARLMRAVHVDGTARLLSLAARRRGQAPLRWVQLSSVGAYGPPSSPGRDRIVDEQTPEAPIGEYEVTKTEADRLLTQAGKDAVVVPTILRPSNVIGPRMRNQALRGIAAMLRRHLFFYIGRPGPVATYVHVDDVAAALMACEAPQAVNHTFNLSSDCLWEDLIARMAARLGAPAPRIRVPETLVRRLVGVAGRAVTLPLTPARIDALVNRTRYPSTKLASVLGFHPALPMPEGVDTVLEG